MTAMRDSAEHPAGSSTDTSDCMIRWYSPDIHPGLLEQMARIARGLPGRQVAVIRGTSGPGRGIAAGDERVSS